MSTAHVQVLTSCSLASFSLVDSAQSLCSRTLEVLPARFLARLTGLAGPSAGQHKSCQLALPCLLGPAASVSALAVRQVLSAHVLPAQLSQAALVAAASYGESDCSQTCCVQETAGRTACALRATAWLAAVLWLSC